MKRYTEEQIGKKKITGLSAKSKSTYGLYVDQGSEHEPVLVGVDWQSCRDKTKELIDNFVSPLDIYGDSDARTGKNFYQARKHLWLPEQV